MLHLDSRTSRFHHSTSACNTVAHCFLIVRKLLQSAIICGPHCAETLVAVGYDLRPTLPWNTYFAIAQKREKTKAMEHKRSQDFRGTRKPSALVSVGVQSVSCQWLQSADSANCIQSSTRFQQRSSSIMPEVAILKLDVKGKCIDRAYSILPSSSLLLPEMQVR